MYMHARCKGVRLSFNADMLGDDFRIDGALSVISHSGTPLGKLPSPLYFGGKKNTNATECKNPFYFLPKFRYYFCQSRREHFIQAMPPWMSVVCQFLFSTMEF